MTESSNSYLTVDTAIFALRVHIPTSSLTLLRFYFRIPFILTPNTKIEISSIHWLTWGSGLKQQSASAYTWAVLARLNTHNFSFPPLVGYWSWLFRRWAFYLFSHSWGLVFSWNVSLTPSIFQPYWLSKRDSATYLPWYCLVPGEGTYQNMYGYVYSLFSLLLEHACILGKKYL